MSGDPAGRIWRGLSVALTTPFDARGEVEISRAARHVQWLLAANVDSVVVAGSLGEGTALRLEEKVRLIERLSREAGRDRPVVAAVAAARTVDAVELARAAAAAGASGLLVLPPMIYRGDRREVSEHLRAVIRATDLPAMIYNNPPAYGTDIPPEQVLELVEELSCLTGVKESSGDVRRISALRELLGERVEIAVGIDDALLEGVAAGATGWVAGLANALPHESRRLFDLARSGTFDRARELYRWFLPLLRMDAEPKFVQKIKLVEAELGLGSPRVRPPRLELSGAELAETLVTIRRALADRPGGPGGTPGSGARPGPSDGGMPSSRGEPRRRVRRSRSAPADVSSSRPPPSAEREGRAR